MSLLPDTIYQPFMPITDTTVRVSHEPELDKKLSDILDELNKYCALPAHALPEKFHEVHDKFRTEWSKVLESNRLFSPDYSKIRDDHNEVASGRVYSYCSSLREIVSDARAYYKTDAYKKIKTTAEQAKQSKESYDRRVLTEATDRIEMNRYTGNTLTPDQLWKQRENVLTSRMHNPNKVFEMDVLAKMAELLS